MSNALTDPPATVGIIGCGAVVGEFYTTVLPRIRTVHVSAVADLNTATAAAVAARFGAAVMPAEELVRNCRWVVIATPPESHFALALKALEAGANVVVEKPFATSLAEAKKLVARAEAVGRQVHVAQYRRFFPPVELARQLLATGVIGQLRRVELFEGGRYDWRPQSDYVGKSRFGGVLFDTGSHTVDQALFAAGLDEASIQVTVASVRRDKPEPSHEIDASFTVVTGCQTIDCRLFLSRAQTLANLIRLVGSEAELELDCGYTGGVRLRHQGRLVRLAPTLKMTSPGEAFLAEYLEVFQRQQAARTIARRVLNQMQVLEAVHQHE